MPAVPVADNTDENCRRGGAPAHLGLVRVLLYALWLSKEIVKANIVAAKIILSPTMPLRRNLVLVPADQKSELGRVIFANSITLTPGTVAVRLQNREILVHELAVLETKQQLAGGMGARACRLERGRDREVTDNDSDVMTPISGTGEL